MSTCLWAVHPGALGCGPDKANLPGVYSFVYGNTAVISHASEGGVRQE
ncbi:hypothetical protein QQY66_17340 [Streptomyces sp. DG2A-72]|nr:hypothetical protein [Streptomyces sp. DG2A-72]MDO0933366.1 hypothetical protein [Streptomyces sp. DG2A-72]